MEDDGIEVTRGVGRLVSTMVQFAVPDEIDVTLHDIAATPVLGESQGNGATITWGENSAGGEIHLHYRDNAEVGDTVLDYVPEDGTDGYFTTDTGIPNLTVKLCVDESHRGDNDYYQEEAVDKDLTGLFTGVTIVRVSNVPVGDFELSKTVDPESIEDKFTFELSFAQDIDGLVKDGAIDEDIAGYIAKLLPGDYKYVISGSTGRPAEEGTLTIGDVDGEQGGTEPGEGVGSATYVITNVVPESGNSVYFEGASEGP